jgi:hypothetical protein
LKIVKRILGSLLMTALGFINHDRVVIAEVSAAAALLAAFKSGARQCDNTRDKAFGLLFVSFEQSV